MAERDRHCRAARGVVDRGVSDGFLRAPDQRFPARRGGQVPQRPRKASERRAEDDVVALKQAQVGTAGIGERPFAVSLCVRAQRCRPLDELEGERFQPGWPGRTAEHLRGRLRHLRHGQRGRGEEPVAQRLAVDARRFGDLDMVAQAFTELGGTVQFPRHGFIRIAPYQGRCQHGDPKPCGTGASDQPGRRVHRIRAGALGSSEKVSAVAHAAAHAMLHHERGKARSIRPGRHAPPVRRHEAEYPVERGRHAKGPTGVIPVGHRDDPGGDEHSGHPPQDPPAG